jgi:zinc protease
MISTHKQLLLAGALLVVARPVFAQTVSSTPDEAFRATKPAPLAGELNFAAPVPVERKLKNGLVVLIYENHQIPLVVADLAIKSGVDANPLDKAGLAEFTAALLDEGTKKRSALELGEQLENLAAQLSANAGQDSTRLHLNCLSETLGEALDLLADVTTSPAFRAEDVERVRKAYLTDLAQRQASPRTMAMDAANRVIYGEKHPWGQPSGGTQASVQKLQPQDLAHFHSTYFVPQNAVLAVAGDVKTDELMALLERSFGAWKGKAPAPIKLPRLPEDSRRLIVVDHPGSQSRLLIADTMLSANDPDVVPMKAANLILGGLFSSRLNLNLREDKAFSYGIFSSLAFNARNGFFSAGGNVIAEHTAEAVAEMEKEFTRFVSSGVTPDELNSAKSAYLRSLPSMLETNDAVAMSLDTLVMHRLPLDYFAKLPALIESVNAQEIARVAKKYVKPASWPVVIVGPMGQAQEKLTALGLGPVVVQPVAEPAEATKKK